MIPPPGTEFAHANVVRAATRPVTAYGLSHLFGCHGLGQPGQSELNSLDRPGDPYPRFVPSHFPQERGKLVRLAGHSGDLEHQVPGGHLLRANGLDAEPRPHVRHPDRCSREDVPDRRRRSIPARHHSQANCGRAEETPPDQDSTPPFLLPGRLDWRYSRPSRPRSRRLCTGGLLIACSLGCSSCRRRGPAPPHRSPFADRWGGSAPPPVPAFLPFPLSSLLPVA